MRPSASNASPLSPRRWPPEAFGAKANAAFVAVLVLAVATGLIVGGLVVVLLLHLSGHQLAKSDPEGYRWGAVGSQILVYIPVAFAIARFLPRVAHRSLRELGFRAPTVREGLTALAGAVVMELVVLAAAAIQHAFTRVTPTQAAVQLLVGGHGIFVAAFVVLAVVLAPIVEELVFRGFVFNAFLRWTPVPVAMLASGILFALGHGELTAAFPLACGGIVLAAVYYTTGSLGASATTHALFNLVNVVLLLVSGGKIST